MADGKHLVFNKAQGQRGGVYSFLGELEAQEIHLGKPSLTHLANLPAAAALSIALSMADRRDARAFAMPTGTEAASWLPP